MYLIVIYPSDSRPGSLLDKFTGRTRLFGFLSIISPDSGRFIFISGNRFRRNYGGNYNFRNIVDAAKRLKNSNGGLTSIIAG